MRWHRTLQVASVAAAGVTGCEIDGFSVALYWVHGDVFATADLCTHGQARLSEGYLEDGQIECPLHQGMFDVRTGQATNAPCSISVRTFPVKVEAGTVYVGIEDERN